MLSEMGQGKPFKDSLKALNADIQHANTLALEFPRDYSGSGECVQMRLSYSIAAPFFLFLVQWTDCSLAGALGLMRILIYKVYSDGTNTMSAYERKASLREFYACIYPSLLQLQAGISDLEDSKQRAACAERYRKVSDDDAELSEIEMEREVECGICMEPRPKIVLPDCTHMMCIKCFRDWRRRSQSCPFCRDSLRRVNSADLWIFIDNSDVQDMATLTKENVKRLYVYIDQLPLLVTENEYSIYDTHLK